MYNRFEGNDKFTFSTLVNYFDMVIMQKLSELSEYTNSLAEGIENIF